MSGFKVGDEVFVVQRHRAGRIETIGSHAKGLIYYVRFSEKDVFFYKEDDLLLKSDSEEKRGRVTLKDLLELLLTDEFLDKLSERIFNRIAWTPSPEKSELDQFCKTEEVSE
jgi:hypothetical protein